MMTIEMLIDFTEYATITTIYEGTDRERSWIQVHDFEGFDEDWAEIEIELPEELEIILSDLHGQGWEIRYDSEDI